MKMRLENFRNWSSFWDICVYNKIFRLNWACERKKYIRILFFRESTCIWNCSTVHFFCQENSRSSWRIFAISPDFPSNWYSLWQCRRLVQIHLKSMIMIFGHRVCRASSRKKALSHNKCKIENAVLSMRWRSGACTGRFGCWVMPA